MSSALISVRIMKHAMFIPPSHSSLILLHFATKSALSQYPILFRSFSCIRRIDQRTTRFTLRSLRYSSDWQHQSLRWHDHLSWNFLQPSATFPHPIFCEFPLRSTPVHARSLSAILKSSYCVPERTSPSHRWATPDSSARGY